MYNKVQIFGLEETVTRPIIVQVLKDVSKEIGCLEEPYLYIDLNSNIKKTRNNNRSSSKLNKNNHIQKYAGRYNAYIRVESYEDNVEEGYACDYNMVLSQSRPILWDKEIDLQIKPVMQRRKLDMSLEIGGVDAAYLNSLIQIGRTFSVYNEKQFLHNLEYTYSMSPSLIKLLNSVYVRKKRLWSKDEFLLLEDYLKSISDGRLTKYVSHKEEHLGAEFIAFKEKQVECLGLMEADFNNLKLEEGEDGYFFNVNYSVYYQTPIAYEAKYPIMVYNSLLDKKVFNREKALKGRSYIRNYTGDQIGLRKLFQYPITNDYIGYKNNALTIPAMDDAVPNTQPTQYDKLFTHLFMVDENNGRKDVFNIKKIKKIKFKPYVLEFMLKSEYEVIGELFKSYLYIGLYENNNLINNALTMDEDGNIRSKFELDPRKVYRLGFFILKDLDFLKNEDKARIVGFLKSNLERSRNFCISKKEELIRSGLNYETITTQIATIENEYLSTADIFKKIYGEEVINNVIREQGFGIDVGSKITYTQPRIPKVKQIFNLSINNLFTIGKGGESHADD